MAQQDLVQLLDMVLIERDVLPGAEHQIHQLCVASHLLLIAGLKRLEGNRGNCAVNAKLPAQLRGPCPIPSTAPSLHPLGNASPAPSYE